MNTPGGNLIATVEEFLAHAIELEMEAVDRYLELAASMELHNNLAVAELFRGQAELGVAHVEHIRLQAEGLTLPLISPWDFKWNCPESPECLCMDLVSYLMNAQQALSLALHNEIQGRDFYARVATSSPHPDVQHIAAQLEREENEHIAMLENWLAHEPRLDMLPQEDLDPPNLPD
jgi:rubrerythrin